MLKNEVNYKALAFLAEQTASTFNYEVKGVRALWDPSLSIPGTNRRGGWRCPVGTRYGGQITDRFGRSCGWGIARRIANQIADIGERLENIDDRKRNNRLGKRNARVQRFLARQNKPGLLERGARGLADALDGGDVAKPITTPRAPRALNTPSQRKPDLDLEPIDFGQPRIFDQGMRVNDPRQDAENVRKFERERARRRRGNLRESEQRRMEREIEQPGAPRTGEPPKPNTPRRRRRNATQQGAKRTARRKPEADFVDGSEPAPTKVPSRKPAPKPPAPPKPSTPIPDPPAWDATTDVLGGSVPDAASIRNVRNRFGDERGLPEDAYWRKPDFPEGEEKAKLEKRFGRYYDDKNKRNARGNFVNLQIFGQQAGAPQPQPPAPARPAGPPPILRPIRMDINLDTEFDKPEDAQMVQITKDDIARYKPNAHNNLERFDKDGLKGKRHDAKREQIINDQEFALAFAEWMDKKGGSPQDREEARNKLLNIYNRRQKNYDELNAIEMRIVEIDAGIAFVRKPQNRAGIQIAAPQRPASLPNGIVPINQPPQAPFVPIPEEEVVLPDGKIVPEDLAGRPSPRKIGREQELDDAVKQLHEDGGNLADVKDGIVIDAVVDGQFKDENGNEFTEREVADLIRNGFQRKPTGSKFENRRYKFKLVKQSNGMADVWLVLKVEDKNTGEIWFMKSGTYGANEALLENVGMRAAQVLEFGNNENHLRMGNVIKNDPGGNGEVMPRRWVMMRDIHQWENGVQGDWKDAAVGLNDLREGINPRDVGRIVVMDMVLDNQDRHMGNFMWTREGNRVRLGVIDHGLLGGGRRQGGETEAELIESLNSWADIIVADPGLGRYKDAHNNGIEGMQKAGFRMRSDRDRRILRETMLRSVQKMKADLDSILGVDRIQANGAELSDLEKAHIGALKRVAEARIGWIENNLDDMLLPFVIVNSQRV